MALEGGGSSMSKEQKLRDQILREASVPEHSSVFIVGHGASQVTVYSQQVRALNLVWALSHERSLEDASVVVVGGGIAGVTAAAAAMLHGAKTTILEHHDELLHLQRGCHTRFLHPRIFEWPHRNARRAGAALPILDWSVGTASDVATRILADYHLIRFHRAWPTTDPATVAQEVTNVRDVRISKDGTIRWTGGIPCKPNVIILAVGFGIERTIGGLPLRSYWRVDSLTQTPLDCLDNEYLVYVGGTGDGGIIDVLRATLKEFDHGVFLDECVLRLRGVQSPIKRIERELRDRITAMKGEKWEKDVIDREMSRWLDGQYSELNGLSDLDELLDVVRRTTRVVWTGRLPVPASPFSQPLNRILGWRLWKKSEANKGPVEYKRTNITAVRLLDQTDNSGFRYEVALDPSVNGNAQTHQVVVRHGHESALKDSFPEIYDALACREAGMQGDIEDCVRARYKKLYRPVRPSYAKWRKDIKVRAAPEYYKKRNGRRVWRITVWVDSKRSLRHVSWIDYDLHPEYGTVQRRAIWTKKTKDDGQLFRHWINTWDDYWIRIRCSDGRELGEWLSNAIAKTKVDYEGKQPTDFKKRDRCVDVLRKKTRRSRGKAYHKHPWCSYRDPPD
jgi:hypothetical protein